MRKSTAAVLATGAAFALTAAAATAISVTGPFDPAAGSDAATTCDIGDTTLDSLTDGTDLLGFTIQTSIDTHTDPACMNAVIWVRVDYTDALDLPQSLYAAITAEADYTAGQNLYLDDGGTHASGDFFTGTDLGTDVPTIPLTEATVTNTTVLVTVGTPSNFAPQIAATCYGGSTRDLLALIGPINTTDNFSYFDSSDGSCSVPPFFTPIGLGIYAAKDRAAADALCTSKSASLAATNPLSAIWPTASSHWWFCWYVESWG